MGAKDFIEEILEDIEFYLRYDLLDRIPQNVIFTAIIVILNGIMITFSLLLTTWYIQIPVLALLSFLSLWNTYNFFTQDKTYQLLHAAVDDKKQSIFNPATKYIQDPNIAPPPLISEQQYKLNRYPLKFRTQNLHLARLDSPTVLEDGDIILSQQIKKESEGPKIVEVIKAIYYVLRFLLKILTCSGNFAKRKQMAKWQLRKPAPAKPLRPTIHQRQSIGSQSTQEPPKEQIDLDRSVWELEVWNYTEIQRLLFCFFSPIQVVLLTLSTFYRGYTEWKVVMIILLYIQAIMLDFLVRRFETREKDQRLIDAEVLHEQTVFGERLLNARRYAEKEYFKNHSYYETITSGVVAPSEIQNVTHTPPKVLLVAPSHTPSHISSGVPYIPSSDEQNLSFGSTSSLVNSPNTSTINDGRNHMDTTQSSYERIYLQEEERRRTQEMKAQQEREKQRQEEDRRKEPQRRQSASIEVSQPNPFQKSSRRKKSMYAQNDNLQS